RRGLPPGPRRRPGRRRPSPRHLEWAGGPAGPEGGGAEPAGGLVGGHRAGVVVTLGEAAAQGTEEFGVIGRFDAFGYGGQAHRLGEVDHGGDDGRGGGFG